MFLLAKARYCMAASWFGPPAVQGALPISPLGDLTISADFFASLNLFIKIVGKFFRFLGTILFSEGLASVFSDVHYFGAVPVFHFWYSAAFFGFSGERSSTGGKA